VLVLHDITERQHAQERLAWDYHVQMVLDAILNISTQPPGLKEILQKSLDALLSMPSFALMNKGAIFVRSEDEDVLELAVHRGLPDTLQTACARLPFGRCLCGRAASSHEIIFTTQAEEGDEIPCDGVKPQGHYCVPILANGEVLGVINTYVAAGHVRKEQETHFLKMAADTLASVIQRKRAEEQLEWLAHSDNLTGLPNHRLFYDRLEQALALARRHKGKFALLFLDLDHFKDVNDVLGHVAGDTLLRKAATRLLSCVREMDTVARVGGDEFTIILMETGESAGIQLVAENLLKTLGRPFKISGNQCHIGASIGIAVYPSDGEDTETLVRNADTSMYRAKQMHNTYHFYSR